MYKQFFLKHNNNYNNNNNNDINDNNVIKGKWNKLLEY